MQSEELYVFRHLRHGWFEIAFSGSGEFSLSRGCPIRGGTAILAMRLRAVVGVFDSIVGHRGCGGFPQRVTARDWRCCRHQCSSLDPTC